MGLKGIIGYNKSFGPYSAPNPLRRSENAYWGWGHGFVCGVIFVSYPSACAARTDKCYRLFLNQFLTENKDLSMDGANQINKDVLHLGHDKTRFASFLLWIGTSGTKKHEKCLIH